ncbi:MAG TPA: hypothetical protein VLV83_17670 [Acidobacteriota bacterium]|nr:hypothetical protein [Acidobacteriota bacterium]
MTYLFSNRAALIGLPLVLVVLFVLYLDYGFWMDGKILGPHEIVPETPAGSVVTITYAPCYKIEEDSFHLRIAGLGSVHVLGQLEGLTVGAKANLQGRLLEDGKLRLLKGRAVYHDWFKEYAGVAVVLLLGGVLLREFRRGWETQP